MNLLSTTALHLWQIENHLKYQFILIISNSSMSYKNFVSISGITITPYLDFHSQIWSFTTNICISCLIRIWVENCIHFKMLVKLGQILFMSINKGKSLNFNLLQSIFSTNLKVHIKNDKKNRNKSLPWPGQTSWDLCTCSWLSARCPTFCTVWRPRWIWPGSCKCLPGTPCCHFLPASSSPVNIK